LNSASNTARKRVLIIDDERSIADTLAIILSQAGYEASATYSGESAIFIAQTTTPSLIISDIQMPGIDGITAALKIRALLPKCRVILFSGYPEAHFDRAQANGLEILSKPLSPEVLLKHVHRELEDQTRKNSAGC
jgi:DNA-binding NtrC family response regulator